MTEVRATLDLPTGPFVKVGFPPPWRLGEPLIGQWKIMEAATIPGERFGASFSLVLTTPPRRRLFQRRRNRRYLLDQIAALLRVARAYEGRAAIDVSYE